jgi:hypothetical protein
MKRIRAYLKRPDGKPWPYPTVLSHAAIRISEASANGRGLYLTAEEIRALDYAVIREDGGVETDCFRDHEFTGDPAP